MIFKNDKLIVFQSPFQAKLFNEYKENLFADGTFYISPKIGYQVFITRNYVKEINSFYTTSFSILKDKEQLSYEIVLKELENNVCKVTKNTVINPINFHCDFESAISNAAKKYSLILILGIVSGIIRGIWKFKKINYVIMKLKVIMKFIFIIRQ